MRGRRAEKAQRCRIVRSVVSEWGAHKQQQPQRWTAARGGSAATIAASEVRQVRMIASGDGSRASRRHRRPRPASCLPIDARQEPLISRNFPGHALIILQFWRALRLRRAERRIGCQFLFLSHSGYCTNWSGPRRGTRIRRVFLRCFLIERKVTAHPAAWSVPPQKTHSSETVYSKRPRTHERRCHSVGGA